MLHLVLDLQRQPRFTARPGYHSFEGRRSSAREENVRLIDEGPPGDSFVALESMPGWERDDQCLRQQAFRHQRLALYRWPKNPHMDAPGLQGRYLLRGGEVAQLKLDIRMPPGEESNDLRTAEEVGPWSAPHEQLTDLPTTRPLRDPGGVLGLRDDRPRFSEKHPPGVRQLHVTLCSMKEGRLELLLETPDLLAQGRLRDMESHRRSSKMQLLGHREEIAEVAQLHAVTHIINVSTLLEKYIGQQPPPDRIVSPTPHLRNSTLTGGGACPCFGCLDNLSAPSSPMPKTSMSGHALRYERSFFTLDRIEFSSHTEVGPEPFPVSKGDSMLGSKHFDRIASGPATIVAFLIGSTSGSWAQDSVGPTSPPLAVSGSTVSTMLTLGFLAAIVTAIVVVARFLATRRKRIEEATILQSQLFDVIAREAQLRGLTITPRARVSRWRGSPVTIEVAGEVPTPDLREAVMRIVSAEAWRLRPDAITVDHLFIVPPVHRASERASATG